MFSLVAALGVALFQFRMAATISIEPEVVVPYVAVIAGASLLGAAFSGWYFRETGIFELIATPIVVIVSATVLAGVLWAVSLMLSDTGEADSIADVLSFALYASLIFLYFAWPILLPGAAISSYLLWRRYSSL